MVVQVGNLADLARKQVMEHTFRQQGIAEITRTGRCQTDTQIVEIVKVALQVLPCKAVRNPGKSSSIRCQSIPPSSESFSRGTTSLLISRKAMSENESVLFVTTLSNCIHRLFVSSHTFIR